ncbi:MLO protein like 1 [Sesbania bispinosa]|nr:MLO protein like 1 [Sesbania bispinosa]
MAKGCKEKRKLRKAGTDYPSGCVSGETTPSQGTSPLHLLQKYKPSHNTDTDSVLYSPRSYQSDTDFSETEGSTHELNQISQTHQAPRNQETHNIDFSFVKP